MKTCLIYGQNGLDLDVAFNLRSFYKKLGFCVVFSDKLFSVDLLVILRGIDSPLKVTGCNFGFVNVYDYGGWGYDALVKSLDYNRTTIFTTSPKARQRIIRELGFPERNIQVAFPPVEIQLWSKPHQHLKYEKVHIGHYKPIDGNDEIKDKFIQTIIDCKANVWGLGWGNVVEKSFYHGKLGSFRVSDIYAKSRFAFGLMYPFQRLTTFSGRFWHAPLNGCYLFSEPGIYTKEIPGIIETDYTKEDIHKKLNATCYDRNKLFDEAKKYWTKQYLYILSYVKPTLDKIEYKSWSIKYKMRFLYLLGLTHTRIVYQKYEFFKYLKK